MSMRAFQLVEWQQPPELRDVEVPRPGPGQVLVKVAGSGACHSDLHFMEWPGGILPFDLPFTLGHEATGWVAELGAGVTGWSEGDAVAIYGPWGCGVCRACRLSAENYCEHAAELRGGGAGLGLDGGMAEYVLVPHARSLVPLGDLDPVEVAPLGDAALTPYHAIKRVAPTLVPGTNAVVIGCGGLGHLAIQILRACTGARVIAVDTDTAKLQLAKSVGADETVVADAGVVEHVRAAAGNRGADFVLDLVASDATLGPAAQMVRPQGRITLVGMGMGSVPVSFFTLPYEVSVSTTYWGSLVEYMEVLALAADGRIHAHIERFPLDRVAEAYDRLRRGDIEGRAVVTP
jgi:propanol-preferring alcohol dehydrogenase